MRDTMPGYITESEAKFMSIKDSAKDKFRESIDLYHEFVPSEKPAEQPVTEAPPAEEPKQEPTAGESEPKQETSES